MPEVWLAFSGDGILAAGRPRVAARYKKQAVPGLCKWSQGGSNFCPLHAIQVLWDSNLLLQQAWRESVN
jgi:hypothetical protein